MISRRDMERGLSLKPGAPTKTFVLEVHTFDRPGFLVDQFGRSRVQDTSDAFLQLLHLEGGVFWVDQLDPRFWSFHTDLSVSKAYPVLRDFVNSRRDVDWMWLPSNHLRHLWPGATSRRVRTEFRGDKLLGESATARDLRVQFAGHDAESLLDWIAEDPRFRSVVSFDATQISVQIAELGFMNEAVNRMGRFAVSGESLEFHLEFVRAVVGRYRQLVELVERSAMTYEAFGDGAGGTATGQPVVIEFSHAIEDMDRFLRELFSSREPFRLWGVPEMTDYGAEVEAVDLHVGDRLRLDIGREWLRIYVGQGTCGNTIARLISNLQHQFDGALRVVDPILQAAIDAQDATSAATPR